MTFIYFLLMGIVQGITEFMPVSSTGHLTILQKLFHLNYDGILFTDVILHLGTLVTIFMIFKKDIIRAALDTIRIVVDLISNVHTFVFQKSAPEEKNYRPIVHTNHRKFALFLVLSTIPSCIIGLVSRHLVTYAVQSLLAPGVFFLITGILLLVLDYIKKGKKFPKDVTYADAVWIGIFQGLAVFPGVSRLGITLVVALLLGFQRNFAIKYAFLLSIPAYLGAFFVELIHIKSSGLTLALAAYSIVGAIVAAVVGMLCIRGLVALLQKKKFKFFAVYSFGIGILAIVGNFILV